jgi:ABC-type lipoprotein export system ATPase subunit
MPPEGDGSGPNLKAMVGKKVVIVGPTFIGKTTLIQSIGLHANDGERVDLPLIQVRDRDLVG